MKRWGLGTRMALVAVAGLSIALGGHLNRAVAQEAGAEKSSKQESKPQAATQEQAKGKAPRASNSKNDAPPLPKVKKNKKSVEKKASPKKVTPSNKKQEKKQDAKSTVAKTGTKKSSTKKKIEPVKLTPISKQLQSVILGKKDATLNDFRGMQMRVNQLVSKLRPAVVGIRSGGGQGTGVIVTADGLVLTAAHVIGKRGREASVVMPDGSVRRAVALGTDSRADSGMLKILDKEKYPYVDIGESGTLNEGQWVMALGHPGGYDRKRASVVRVGRMLVKPGRTTLQTDCTLVGGDSGGPLFDMNGMLIGIHSRISRRIQQNYHVSIDYFTDTWDTLEAELKPYLGFSLDKGKMTISKVAGPASTARMKKGDLLLKIGDQEVKSRDDIKKVLKSLKFDQKVDVVVSRDKKEKTLKFRIGGK